MRTKRDSLSICWWYASANETDRAQMLRAHQYRKFNKVTKESNTDRENIK